MAETSLAHMMHREDSPTSMRCWQGEEEVEDRWGSGSPAASMEHPGSNLTREGFEILGRSRSGHQGSTKMHRMGRRVLSCFKRGSINLMVPEQLPSTPPRSGPLIAPRSSFNGFNGFTFMDEAIDQHTDDDEDREPEEPTSPVVNCIGQVRPKAPKHAKIVETPREQEDKEKLQRTKSRAQWPSPPAGAPSKLCKWKQLLRSSNSVSPSSHPLAAESAEPEIDLGRFSSSSCSGEPFFPRSAAATSQVGVNKFPDKTASLVPRNAGGGSAISAATAADKTLLLLQQQLDERECGNREDQSLETAADNSEADLSEPPRLKKAASRKWYVDEPQWCRRRGVRPPSRLDLQKGSTSAPPSLP